MKRCIGSAKPHRAVFRFFARYYDAQEVIHNRISWNWEDISNSGPKAMPKIIINWTFNEKVHRIRKSSQRRFSLFCKILRCWRSDSSAHFLKLRRYFKLWPQSYAKNYKKLNFNEKVYRIRKTTQKLFRPFARYYDAEEVIHKRNSWNWEDISNSGPKAMPKIIKKWTFYEKVHRIRKTS